MTTSDEPTTMPASQLGAGGPIVSRYALGTMTFGNETDEAGSREQLDAFVAAGGTLIDTADVYSHGESESIIGRWLADRPDVDVVIATKGRFFPPAGSHGGSRRGLTKALDASLERLGVDAIDLYQVHGWDDATPLEETLDTLSTFVRHGKVHSIGWSNVTGWQLSRIMTTCRLTGQVLPVSLQPQYNLLDRGIELEVLPVCIEEGLGLLPWSPLGGGWLAGKYRRDQRPSGATRLGEDPERGVEAYDLRNTDRTWAILDVVEEIAERHGRPMTQVALAWVAGRPTVGSVLIGARTLDQLNDNLGAAGWDLDQDDRRTLDEISAPGLFAYPYTIMEEFTGLDHWRELRTARPAG